MRNHLSRLWTWYNRSWLRLPINAAIGALVLISLSTMVAVHIYGQQNRLNQADVIIVLGAGVDEDGSPSEGTTRRTAHGVWLYHEGYAPRIMCTGGFAADRPVREANACQQVALSLGMPESAIILEDQSKSTEENGIFSHALMQENGWLTAIVVSDNYHLLRTDIIFTDLNIPVVGISPAEVTQHISWDDYLWHGMRRETMGLFWQAFKEFFNLPYTHVNGI